MEPGSTAIMVLNAFTMHISHTQFSQSNDSADYTSFFKHTNLTTEPIPATILTLPQHNTQKHIEVRKQNKRQDIQVQFQILNTFKPSKTKLIAFIVKQMISKIHRNCAIVKIVLKLGMSGRIDFE